MWCGRVPSLTLWLPAPRQIVKQVNAAIQSKQFGVAWQLHESNLTQDEGTAAMIRRARARAAQFRRAHSRLVGTHVHDSQRDMHADLQAAEAMRAEDEQARQRDQQRREQEDSEPAAGAGKSLTQLARVATSSSPCTPPGSPSARLQC